MSAETYDAIVIGAGFGGLRMLHELREQGLSTRVLEAGTDVGGTWYWNRYPGARTDSESWQYILNFSSELNAEWRWSERYPQWDEVQRYLGHVADRFDMRKDITFETRVEGSAYDEEQNLWRVRTDAGEELTCTYLIMATGVLSLAYDPPFEGLDEFEGEWHLTARWPKDEVDFTGKRVGLIGTGATGVQVAPVVAQLADHLTVLQRTPNFVIPGRNRPLYEEDQKVIQRDYDRIWEQCRQHFFAFDMQPAGRLGTDVSPEEFQRVLERGWELGGFRFIFETFDDLFVNPETSERVSEFVRAKIRAIVADPGTAEILCPKTHAIPVKRPPLGHGYYETFNRDNVSIVDLTENGIDRVTPKGVRLADGTEHEFDMLIFATGFDAGTGALTSMDVRGRGGQVIGDRWDAGPATYLGIAVDGFPNMFMISGPQSSFANIPVVIDSTTRWIGRAIEAQRRDGLDVFEATPQAVEGWCTYMDQLLEATVLREGRSVNSWFLGANIPGKPQVVLFYFGGAGRYIAECEKAADDGFEGFSRDRQPVPA